MLIVNSHDTVLNLDGFETMRINSGETYYLNYLKNGKTYTIDMFLYIDEAKQMLQDILDAYAKGTRVFYINGRIV